MPETNPTSIDFHYAKSNCFKVLHCDGVWGGVTPRGYISMSCYSERYPIPKRLNCEVGPDGNLKETSRDSKSGIIRQVGVEILMDAKLAESVVAWLNEMVAQAKARASQQAEMSE